MRRCVHFAKYERPHVILQKISASAVFAKQNQSMEMLCVVLHIPLQESEKTHAGLYNNHASFTQEIGMTARKWYIFYIKETMVSPAE